MATTNISFPYYCIQADWNEAKLGETIWLHIKDLDDGGQRKNFNLKITGHNELICEEPEPGFSIINYSPKCLSIRDGKSGMTYRFVPPVKCYASIHEKSVTSLDVAPNGLAVSASTDGTMKVWDTYGNRIKCDLKGHVADVNRCRFFPSHQVVLSAGADMALKIWSAIDGHCPVTLRGHHGAVTDVAIVDRGKNVISVGRDGRAKLWCCAKQQCIEDLFDVAAHDGISSPINVCAIRSGGPDFPALPERDDPPHEDSVGTADKVLLMGTESGFVYVIGVHSKKIIFSANCGNAVNAVAFTKAFRFLAGTQNGQIMEFDAGGPTPPLRRIWSQSRSAVLDIRFVCRPLHGLVVARHDGSVEFLLYDEQNSAKEMAQLCGADCDPVNQLAGYQEDEASVWTACRDGRVRQYLLNDAFE